MKKILIPMVVILCWLIACSSMAMGRHGSKVAVVVSIPLLPPIVELHEEPYYYQSGYYYHYDRDRWYYARSKRGPWANLPRDHYPKETRYKGKSWRHDRDDRGRDNNDRGRDNNDRGRDNNDRGWDNNDRGRNQWDDDRGHDH